MTLHQQIAAYVGNISRGMVKLTEKQTSYITSLVLNSSSCRAMLYRYSLLSKGWELQRTFETDQATIDRLIAASLLQRPVQEAYRYDLYNEANELQGQIFTLNPALI